MSETSMSKNGSGSCDLGDGQRELRPGQDNHDHAELVNEISVDF